MKQHWNDHKKEDHKKVDKKPKKGVKVVKIVKKGADKKTK